MVADNSRRAYYDLLQQGKLNGDHRIVYEKIAELERGAENMEELPSRRDIATALKWENGRVSARVTWLKKRNFVNESDRTGTAGKVDPLTGMRVGVLCTGDWNDGKLKVIAKQEPQAVHVELDMRR